MTIKEYTVKEVLAMNQAMISVGALLLIDPKKKKGVNRLDNTCNVLVKEVFERGDKVFVRGNHIPSNRSMVLDQETRVILV
ncbi:MAG: hypothetical protein WC386_03105 [Candidatus Paceibacterota bacterium]